MLNHYFISSLRYVFICLNLFFTSSLLWATHNRAGEITYRQIGPNTIEATITTYTKISGNSQQADRPDLSMDWGDGTSQTIPRTTEVMLYPDIKRNTYTAVHTYPGANLPGRPYVISMQDPNRNEDILNINGGNSVNIEFFYKLMFIFLPLVTLGGIHLLSY